MQGRPEVISGPGLPSRFPNPVTPRCRSRLLCPLKLLCGSQKPLEALSQLPAAPGILVVRETFQNLLSAANKGLGQVPALQTVWMPHWADYPHPYFWPWE